MVIIIIFTILYTFKIFVDNKHVQKAWVTMVNLIDVADLMLNKIIRNIDTINWPVNRCAVDLTVNK